MDQDAPASKPEPQSCHLCGREAVAVVEGEAWCEGCYHVCGSCCADEE